jgi:ferritin-like metal-binding protein YciE
MMLDVTRQLLLNELQGLYETESQMTGALPRMAQLATLPSIRQTLEGQLEGTCRQVLRLGRLLADLGETVGRGTSRTLSRLIDEGGRLALATVSPRMLNRELVKLARYVEQFEIASCGCAISYADLLGYRHVTEALRATMEEKQVNDQKLAAQITDQPLVAIGRAWGWLP